LELLLAVMLVVVPELHQQLIVRLAVSRRRGGQGRWSDSEVALVADFVFQ
jgi:hypothetical protein